MEQHVLKSFNEFEALFNEMAVIPNELFSYSQSYKVGPYDISNMGFYHFDFDPYISLANSLGMSRFGIQGTENRFYLTHMNFAGHGPLCTVRPINLEQLKDLTYLDNMHADYCRNLELNAEPIGLHQL